MGSGSYTVIVLKKLSFLTLEMFGKLMTHVRNISVEIFKEKIIYSIPKYLPHECKEYKYEVIELPDRIEIVAILKIKEEKKEGCKIQ
jgi:hypothetical protein